MDLSEFLILSLVNWLLIFWIIAKRGMASVEGYCAAFLGLAVVSDNLKLLFDYTFQPNTLLLRHNELAFRSFPTVLHIVTFIVLLIGLFLFNPRPDPIGRELSPDELNSAAYTGVVLLGVGLLMATITIYLAGSFSPTHFFQALYSFRTGEDAEKIKGGGFWYRGADLAIFGMALMLAGWGTSRLRIGTLLGGMLFAAFFLKANKGGFETVFLWVALILYTYNRRRFWSFARPRVAFSCLFIALGSLGLKVELLKKHSEPSFTRKALLKSISAPVQGRWGDQGLYRGICQFINLRPRYRYLFADNRIAKYALFESWVPRYFERVKRDQPTKGLGFMVHPDAHEYRKESPSIGLVGSVYADDGISSLVPYVLVIGCFLGILRRLFAGRESSLHWHISYVSFALFGGLSAEAGIISLSYLFFFTFAFTTLAHLAAVVLFSRRSEVRVMPAVYQAISLPRALGQRIPPSPVVLKRARYVRY